MKSKDQLLLEKAYQQIHSLAHFKILNNRDLLDQVASLDGIEVEPDYETDGDSEKYNSGTASINKTMFPKTYATLSNLAKEGKIKVVGGPSTKNMTGRAMAIKEAYNKNKLSSSIIPVRSKYIFFADEN